MIQLNELPVDPLDFFDKNVFFLPEKYQYGSSSFSLDIRDYFSLFQSFQLMDCGFGREYFENDKRNWCYWTFCLNGSEVKLHTSQLTGKNMYPPTFILDFSEWDAFSVIKQLNKKKSPEQQTEFQGLLKTDTVQNQYVASLFQNYLFAALRRQFTEVFHKTFPIQSVDFLRSSSNSIIFDVVFTFKNTPYRISFERTVLGGNTFVFADDFKSMGSLPQKLVGLHFGKKLTLYHFFEEETVSYFLINLTESLLAHSILSHFSKSRECKLRSSFDPLFQLI